MSLYSYSLSSYALAQFIPAQICHCKLFPAKLCPCTAIPCPDMPFDSIGGTTGGEHAGISEGSVPLGHPFSYEVHISTLGLKPATNRLTYVNANIL